jgi:hypothetical protein
MEVAKSSMASGSVVRRRRGSNEGGSCGRSEIDWERERQEAAGGSHALLLLQHVLGRQLPGGATAR